MSIDVSYAAPGQRVLTDKAKKLLICGYGRLRQALKRVQYDVALAQITQRQLTDDEGVRQDTASVEQLDKARIALA